MPTSQSQMVCYLTHDKFLCILFNFWCRLQPRVVKSKVHFKCILKMDISSLHVKKVICNCFEQFCVLLIHQLVRSLNISYRCIHNAYSRSSLNQACKTIANISVKHIHLFSVYTHCCK